MIHATMLDFDRSDAEQNHRGWFGLMLNDFALIGVRFQMPTGTYHRGLFGFTFWHVESVIWFESPNKNLEGESQ